MRNIERPVIGMEGHIPQMAYVRERAHAREGHINEKMQCCGIFSDVLLASVNISTVK